MEKEPLLPTFTETEQVNQPKKEEKIVTLRLNSGVIMFAALVLLLIFSVAQAAQLNGLRNKIATGDVKALTTVSPSSNNASSAGTSSGTSGSSSTQSSNLQNLPSQVGGC